MGDLLTWNGELGKRGGETLAHVRRSHLDHGSPQWEWTCVVRDCVWRNAYTKADGQAAAEAMVRDWLTRIVVVATDGAEVTEEWRVTGDAGEPYGPYDFTWYPGLWGNPEVEAREFTRRIAVQGSIKDMELTHRTIITGPWVKEPLDEEGSGE
jgi:hypothetical protein